MNSSDNFLKMITYFRLDYLVLNNQLESSYLAHSPSALAVYHLRPADHHRLELEL